MYLFLEKGIKCYLRISCKNYWPVDVNQSIIHALVYNS